MQVHYTEGPSGNTGPAPCAVLREGGGEASTGERTGQLLSRERFLFPGADTVSSYAEGNTPDALSPAPGRSGVVGDPACADAPCTGTGRSHVWPGRNRGPRREGEEPKPTMNGDKKSDLAIVADEAGEQSRATGRGVGGAKGGTEGKRTSTARAGRSAGQACHRRWSAYGSSKGKEEGTVHRAAPPCRCGCFGRLLCPSGTRHLVWTE